MSAIVSLKNEHGSARLMLNYLSRMVLEWCYTGQLSKDHIKGIFEFFDTFVDRCHHAKEEEVLFPALETAGFSNEGLIAMILEEHEKCKNDVKAMGTALPGFMAGEGSSREDVIRIAGEYIPSLHATMEKEDNLLFVAADRLLSEKRQNELVERFNEIEAKHVSHETHKKFHDLFNKLGEAYPAMRRGY